MKRIGIIGMFLLSTVAFAQGADTTLEGRWELFKIIDNMTGDEIKPTHKSADSYVYWIRFMDGLVRYNLEINTCSNEVIVGKDRSIEFKYFSECTEICCDAEFSKLLTYPECTKYYIKNDETLIMVSEDRIFYFKKSEDK
ncbi:MAG: hypothetical protein HUJ25_13265 [Crocinitomicaceae bacterium]|nr:hypothetical protein [Crocinitomicaceae bacterium]